MRDLQKHVVIYIILARFSSILNGMKDHKIESNKKKLIFKTKPIDHFYKTKPNLTFISVDFF